MLVGSFKEIGEELRTVGRPELFDVPVGDLAEVYLEPSDRKLLDEVLALLGVRVVGDLFDVAIDRELERSGGLPARKRIADAVALWLFDPEVLGDDDQDYDEEPVPAAPSPRPLEALPTERAALRAWAEARGVLERLSDVMATPRGLYDPSDLDRVLTREDILVWPPEPVTNPRQERDWRVGKRREVYVQTASDTVRFADNVAFLRRRPEELLRTRQAIDPALAEFARAVVRIRAAIAATSPATPGLVGQSIPGPLVFQDDPPRLLYDELPAEGWPRMHPWRGGLVEVPLRDWRSRTLDAVCHCGGRGSKCPHRLAAFDEIHELLQQPTAPAYRGLHAFLTTAPWRRALARLEGRVASGTRPEAAARLLWSISVDGERVALDPMIQKRKGEGRWSRGTALSIRNLLRQPALLADATDARALDILTGGQGSDDWYGNVEAGSVFRAIEALAGATNVFLADRKDTPVAIRVAVPRLELTRAAEDGTSSRRNLAKVRPLRLALRVGDRLLTPAQAIAKAGPERYLVDLDVVKNQCWLARVDADLQQILSTLVVEDVTILDDDVPELLAGFERLSPRLRIDVPAELRGEEVAVDERLVCRLTPVGDHGLHLELLVRPLPESESYPPGEGPAVLTVRRSGGPVHCVREPARETASAAALVGALGLGREDETRAWSYQVTDVDRAVSMVTALGERSATVVTEWPADAWRLVRAERRALRLAVSEKRDWFGLEGGIEIDGETVSIAALLEAIRRGRRYLVLGPQRFAIIEEELRARLAPLADVTFEGRGGLELGAPAVEHLSALVDEPDQLELIPSFVKTRERLRRAATLQPVPPAGFRAELRPYQSEGFRWLMRLADAAAGACLADDMGLGKTVQLLAVLQARAPLGPALVVAPTSVVANWMNEAQRFAPGLRPVLYRGAERAGLLAQVGPGDLLVTSYALAVMDEEALAGVHFSALVLDEAQALKNASTRRARAIRKMQADWRIALTGTPIENHLGELWSLYRIVSPALFGSWEQFRERFAHPIERMRDPGRRAALSRVLQPFLLRRTKEAVASELPPKTYVDRFVELGAGERRAYEATRLAVLASLQGKGQPAREAQQRIEVLAALTRMRQLACHPKLGDERSQERSAKLTALLEILREVREAGHRVLVFSQFTRLLDLAREALTQEGIVHLHFDGATPAPEREARVAAFQRGEATAFLISLRAGGTGINLTAADYVIHLDPWWNPAVEDQATDRAHRIGQDKAVTVVRLIARGTIEEAVLSLHADKRGLAAAVLEGSDTVARLETRELIALLESSRAEGDADEEALYDVAGDEEPPEPRSRAGGGRGDP